jgi:hypothetical protein
MLGLQRLREHREPGVDTPVTAKALYVNPRVIDGQHRIDQPCQLARLQHKPGPGDPTDHKQPSRDQIPRTDPTTKERLRTVALLRHDKRELGPIKRPSDEAPGYRKITA